MPADKNHLLLMHLSDIHFCDPYCLNPTTDPEHLLRKALIKDVRQHVETMGPVDAILISGDIAYKGHLNEYSAAKAWLRELASAAMCSESQIYPVPGNHDLSRSIASERVVEGYRKTVTDKPSGPIRDQELAKAMLEEECFLVLFRPMLEYNKFAAAYNCDLMQEYKIFNPALGRDITTKMPFWKTELPITDGWKLVMHGLTSTLFSGPENDRRGGEDLYLGSLQYVFPVEDGIVRLAMLHHPPDWFGDHDQADEALSEGCELHLLGHKHRQRHFSTKKYVRLAAGAVNPARNEPGWEPGYNFIKLQINETAKGPSLQIDATLLKWQGSPDRFTPKQNDDGGNVFTDHILLRRKPSAEAATAAGASAPPDPEPTSSTSLEVPMETISERDLVLTFWNLTNSQRWDIVMELGLLNDAEKELPEPLRYRKAFEHAREKNKMPELKVLIEKSFKG